MVDVSDIIVSIVFRVAISSDVTYSVCNMLLVYTAHESKNFIVGLTNVSPLDSKPTLWQYTLCGQYPGAVTGATTVSLHCPYNLPPFRYVIVQFPITDQTYICELEVIAPGRPTVRDCQIYCYRPGFHIKVWSLNQTMNSTVGLK